MMSKDLLKQIGIIGVSFGLVASPLAFAQSTNSEDIADQDSVQTDQAPAAQATESASDPSDKMGGGSAGSVEDDAASGYGPGEDEMPPQSEATNSLSDPTQKEDGGQGGQLSDSSKDLPSAGYEPSADEKTPAEEATTD